MPLTRLSRVSALASVGMMGAGGALAAAPAPTLSGATMVVPTAAKAGSTGRSLSQHFADTVNAADYGMLCNGASDDTAAMTAAVGAAVATGGELVLPAGRCRLTAPIAITTAKSIWLRGRGRGATTLLSTAAGDVLDVAVSQDAGFTVSDLMIARASGTLPAGTLFGGKAISIVSPDLNQSDAAGQVTLTRLTIQPPTAIGQTDGFADGISLINTDNAVISDVQIFEPGFAGPVSGLPNPTNGATVTTPASLGYNVADGIYIGGANASFSADTDIDDVTVTGGLAGLDIGPAVQGVYVKGSKFIANVYGARSISNGTSNELLTATLNHFNDLAAGVYINGMSDSLVSDNFFFHLQPNGSNVPWQGIWIQNGGANTVVGNSIVGNGASEPQPSMAIAMTNDAGGGFGGFPDTVSGNVAFSIGGACLYNSATMTNIVGTGNDLSLCEQSSAAASTLSIVDGTVSATTDPWGVARAFGSNLYATNNTTYPTIVEDSNGDVHVRRSLLLGGPYDASVISMMSNGVGTFFVDASGNATAKGTVTANAVSASSVAVSGASVVGSTPGHQVRQYEIWAYSQGTFALTTNGAVPGGGNMLAPLPLTGAGSIAVTGDVLCFNASTHQTWHYSATWAQSGTTLSLQNLAFAESDGQAATGSGWSIAGAVFNGNVPNVQVTGPTANVDCTGSAAEIMDQ